ncbi:MAG: hypothetical protein KDC10_01000 [Calditrichaeota bacterium]|nr:hypothetical protein [Candidatus Cloacimonadota bacterium]MCB1045749.1 hypothetical protein [Calditrichota bacterium]MCB9472255.1 hypothetical protein [Candidatus Delongbacteria bacterium]
MARRHQEPMSIGQQFRFLGGFSWLILSLGSLAIFMVWKQVECSTLRTSLFQLESECASLLAQNEQLKATRLNLGSFSVIRSQAEHELGMVMPAGEPDWIIVSASRVVRGAIPALPAGERDHEPYEDPGGTVACVR